MKYFMDTEFIEGFHKPLHGKNRHFIDLISIGVTCEDGREYYAVSKEFDEKDANDWVKKNVIPRLPFSFQTEFWKTNEEIRKELILFFQGNIETNRVPENIEVYGYFADYDWVLFCSLFGTMMDLPEGFPNYCLDLKQMMHQKGLSADWKREHCPDPVDEHSAIVDARWNKKLYDLLINIKP